MRGRRGARASRRRRQGGGGAGTVTSDGFSVTLAEMKGSLSRALIVGAVVAAAFTGVALAGNTVSFADPANDSGTAPDLVGVAISNDDAGVVTVKVTLSNRSVVLGTSDGVG